MCTQAQSKEEMLISSAMNEQTAAWNAGDMKRYMNTYWKSDSLMFIGKNVEYGRNNLLKNYKKAHPDTAAMGKPDFKRLSLKLL